MRWAIYIIGLIAYHTHVVFFNVNNTIHTQGDFQCWFNTFSINRLRSTARNVSLYDDVHFFLLLIPRLFGYALRGLVAVVSSRFHRLMIRPISFLFFAFALRSKNMKNSSTTGHVVHEESFGSSKTVLRFPVIAYHIFVTGYVFFIEFFFFLRARY